ALLSPLTPRPPTCLIGLNLGPQLVCNIRSDTFRNFTAIGDTVNVASRLQETAQPGQVVIGPRTYDAIRDRAVLWPLGPVHVRGRADPVDAFVLERLDPGLAEGYMRTYESESL